MKLHWSPRSPFVRKVMVAAHELGLTDRIETTRTLVAMDAPNAGLMHDNPISKIPTLVLDDGTVLYDSLTICEYLDSLAAPRLFPPPGPARWAALTRHALAQGMLDTLILWRYERMKPAALQTPALLDSWATKTASGLDALDRMVPLLDAAPTGIAHLTIGLLLAYIDFRFDDLGWRTGRPALATWSATFSARPSMRATEAAEG